MASCSWCWLGQNPQRCCCNPNKASIPCWRSQDMDMWYQKKEKIKQQHRKWLNLLALRCFNCHLKQGKDGLNSMGPISYVILKVKVRRDYPISVCQFYLPTKFSSTELFPALWPPTTAICGRSRLQAWPMELKASCSLLTSGISSSMPRFPMVPLDGRNWEREQEEEERWGGKDVALLY